MLKISGRETERITDIKEHDYKAPVSHLLTRGQTAIKEWPNYLELGLSKEHIPELIRMVEDEDLYWAEEEDLRWWAGIHAWRALGQLQAEEAVEPLLKLLYRIDEHDYWVSEEAPMVFKMIGPPALPALTSYLASGPGLFARICVADSIKRIGDHYPETKEQCIDILTNQLKKFSLNDKALNAFLILYLVKIQALDSMGVIREAFHNKRVDYNVMGDLEDVEIHFGIREFRSTPRPKLGWPFDEKDEKDTDNSHNKTNKTKKVGRNDPCPCGSGKKYKKCCLNKAS